MKVNYYCDFDGDHQAPIYQCTDTKMKEFKSTDAALNFINECTKVELDVSFNTISKSEIPDLDPILSKTNQELISQLKDTEDIVLIDEITSII